MPGRHDSPLTAVRAVLECGGFGAIMRAAMGDFAEAFHTAGRLIIARDPTLVAIVLLSLRVSLGAVSLAALIGLPLGALLALARFRGRGGVIIVLNACMGFPPVIAGLVLYLLLSRAGPLGSW